MVGPSVFAGVRSRYRKLHGRECKASNEEIAALWIKAKQELGLHRGTRGRAVRPCYDLVVSRLN